MDMPKTTSAGPETGERVVISELLWEIVVGSWGKYRESPDTVGYSIVFGDSEGEVRAGVQCLGWLVLCQKA